MNKFKGLAAGLAAAVLVVPSAFAESRHSHETHGRDSGGRSIDRSSRSESRSESRGESRQNWNRGGSNENRSFDRGRSENRSFDRNNDRSFDRNNNRNFNDRNNNNNRNFDNNRSFDRNNNRGFDRNNNRNFDNNRNRGFDNNRSFDRGRSNDRGRSFDHGRSFDRGRAFFHEGRVSRYERWNNGYRVWLFGAPYPFFIPEARFRLFPRFHVGLSIRLGGYYNPLGYYDYYDGAYDPYYAGSSYVGGELRGIVESVDYRRGTALIADQVSNRFVTITLRGDDPRFGDLRIGDYVELSGDWSRIGTFEAYRVDFQDAAGYRYRR